jgi:multisubunit Na+/H+ antiporter MnhB subunit
MIGSGLLRTTTRLLAPVMVLASLWLLLRGHQSVGGGFIGGLTAGSAIVLQYFSVGHRRVWRLRWLATFPLIGGGTLIAVGYGLGGLALTATFLDGAKVALPVVGEVAASLVFDVGVYVVVVGIVATIVRHLGQGTAEPGLAEPDEPSFEVRHADELAPVTAAADDVTPPARREEGS